jgi:hypothetical protein
MVWDSRWQAPAHPSSSSSSNSSGCADPYKSVRFCAQSDMGVVKCQHFGNGIALLQIQCPSGSCILGMACAVLESVLCVVLQVPLLMCT